MTPREKILDRGRLRAAAVYDGRARSELHVFVDGARPAAVVEYVVLADAADRDRVAEKIAATNPELRAEAEALIRDLATAVAEERTARGDDDAAAPAPPPNPAELLATARDVLKAPSILAQVGEYVRASGYAGDTRAPELVYLAVTSRLLERPVNLFLSGPSGGGKNFTVHSVLPLFPATAYYAVAGMSPLAVMYSDESFQHRTLIVNEAAAFHQDGIGASLIRGLAWDAELRYDTVIDGAVVHLRKEGPTGLVTTGTRSLEPELATRLWTVPVPDTPEQTRGVIAARARIAAAEVGPAPGLAPWIAAQQWLELAGERRVVIPFAPELAELMPVDEVRMRRDFDQLLSLVAAHAILHQLNRERDEAGRVIASEADYAAVYDRVGPVFQASISGCTDEVRATVRAVAALTREPGSTATVSAVAAALKLSGPTTWRRVRAALAGHWLANDETRKHQPARLRVGAPMPDAPGLPAPAEIVKTRKRTTQPVGTSGVERFHERFHGEGGGVKTAEPEPDPPPVTRSAPAPGATPPAGAPPATVSARYGGDRPPAADLRGQVLALAERVGWAREIHLEGYRIVGGDEEDWRDFARGARPEQLARALAELQALAAARGLEPDPDDVARRALGEGA